MNIFVGCASRDTNKKEYIETAEKIGKFIANNNHNYVFGGCACGLMGTIYNAIKSQNSNSKIIIASAKAYEDDIKPLYYDEVYLSDTVNERKTTYTQLSDVLVFIPGGIGTLDEILTAIETRRNHEHNLPIIIVNTNNFFSPFLEMLNKIYKEDFADIRNKNTYYIASSPEDAIKHLNNLCTLV